MSAILKGMMQPPLQAAIQAALASFGNDASGYTGPGAPLAPTSAGAELDFAAKLSMAISTVVSATVQAYLVANVTTAPAPGPVSHVHKIVAP